MPRILVVLIIPLLVAGCALPLPLRVATWAAEGVVYLATKKSFTDHGLSAITGKDCALLRAATGDDICNELEQDLPEGTMVADASDVVSDGTQEAVVEAAAVNSDASLEQLAMIPAFDPWNPAGQAIAEASLAEAVVTEEDAVGLARFETAAAPVAAAKPDARLRTDDYHPIVVAEQNAVPQQTRKKAVDVAEKSVSLAYAAPRRPATVSGLVSLKGPSRLPFEMATWSAITGGTLDTYQH